METGCWNIWGAEILRNRGIGVLYLDVRALRVGHNADTEVGNGSLKRNLVSSGETRRIS